MIKICAFVLLLTCASADDKSGDLSDVGRQKRLLFFDEGGSLVKTYPNPYMNQLNLHNSIPNYGNFLNPFFSFIRAFGSSLAAYVVPVSNAILQQIKKDPNFQNSLVIIPKKDPVVEPNPLCAGKRTQIPAPNLCNNFLNCWDGWAFEQECPEGLLFSSQGYCDYADNVDCNNRKLDVAKPQPQPMCKQDFEAFRNQENCNEFFICVNRQPVRFQCPANLAYSQVLGVCDYADRVDCQSSGSSLVLAPQPSYPAITDSSPSAPSLPTLSVSPPESSVPSVTSPVIPPAPSASPPVSSLLPPGSVFPSIPPAPPLNQPSSISIPSESIISQIFPSQRPVPPAVVFPAQISGSLQKPSNKPIFTPACSPGNVAMSREDAVRLLQQAHITY